MRQGCGEAKAAAVVAPGAAVSSDREWLLLLGHRKASEPSKAALR